MANWCMNLLRVTGPAEDVTRFQEQAAAVTPCQERKPESTPEAFSFQRLVPLPAKRRTTDEDTDGGGSPRQAWGCRSDAFHSEQVETWEGGVVYRFVTPWKPPTAFFLRVSELWPTLVFVLDYEEADGFSRPRAGGQRRLGLPPHRPLSAATFARGGTSASVLTFSPRLS